MKISVDGVELFTLSTTHKDVIKNDIRSDVFEDDMKRRVQWVLEHKYERCFKALKDEWTQKLIDNGEETIPTDPDEFAELVFDQPNYKNRTERDLEAYEV